MNSFKRQEGFSSGTVIGSVNLALEGIVHTLRSERNMRVHFLVGFLVVIAGIYFRLAAIEFLLLCFAVTLVLVAELFNTAVEHAIDLVSDDFHPLAKVVKDIAAGAVFLTAVNASIVGYILLLQRVNVSIGRTFHIIKQSPKHITFIALISVIGIVLLIKILRKEEHLLRGGMPSGHSAVAFAAWTTVAILTENAIVGWLVFFLAVLIAKSRIVKGVHTLWEVTAGSFLGALVTLLVFQILL